MVPRNPEERKQNLSLDFLLCSLRFILILFALKAYQGTVRSYTMATAITFPDQLLPKLKKAVKKEGFSKPKDFVYRLIEEKLLEIEEQERIIDITNRVRAALETKGIGEERTFADFEKYAFRHSIIA